MTRVATRRPLLVDMELSTFRSLASDRRGWKLSCSDCRLAARGVLPMARKFAVALITAVLVGLAGCSGESAAPGTPSGTATSSTRTAVVVEPRSSSAAPSPEASSSFVVPTPSVIDVPTPTSANPWPADLTPEQVVDAQAALATYRRYQEFVDRAGSRPGE